MADQVTVFLSHTQGMRQYPAGESFLDGAERAVNSVPGAKAIHMEFFPAADRDPATMSERFLADADIYLALIGFDYGSALRGDPSRSYTEFEFDAATRIGKERLVFLLAAEAAHLQQMHASNVSAAQARFRQRLEDSGATVAYFKNVDDLKFRISQALRESMADRARHPTQPTFQAQPAQAPGGCRRLGALALLVAIVMAVAVGVGAWSLLIGAFPPWDGRPECSDVSGQVLDTSPETHPLESGATLVIEIRNQRGSAVALPSQRDVTVRGATGRQYEISDALSDRSWFFDIEVAATSTIRLELGVVDGGGSDTVTLQIPGVRSTTGLSRCTLTLPPVEVDFAG
jgi:hypothetical protein